MVGGGGRRDLSGLGLPAEPNAQSLERVVTGVEIYRVLRVPLVVMGGNGDPWTARPTDGDTMATAARRLGVPKDRIVIENRSRNTFESAEALRDLIPGRTIVLVTSAYHIRRAVALFAGQGFSVQPAPAGFLGERRSLALSFSALVPSGASLVNTATALHEYLSLGWYLLTGAAKMKVVRSPGGGHSPPGKTLSPRRPPGGKGEETEKGGKMPASISL